MTGVQTCALPILAYEQRQFVELLKALVALSQPIDQFSLGNEQEYQLNGLTNAQFADFIRSLAVSIRGVYSGRISYETSGDFADFWAGQTLGSIDLLGLNLYCGSACNQQYLKENLTAHGVDHVYVSESNADMNTGKYNDDTVHAAEVASDFINLLSTGVKRIYYFDFAASGNLYNVADNWGLYQNGILAQPLTASVLGIRY